MKHVLVTWHHSDGVTGSQCVLPTRIMPEPTTDPFQEPTSTITRKPHRCNLHLEDVMIGLNRWPVDFSKPFAIFRECLKSKPGEEPVRYKFPTVQKPEDDST
ncbi:hypothetical protein BC936DRAFT_138310 [Jimgerdemannia flammicorona]|uniref:Uncharacterized protein n=1 Tax=Jimgerdemannia flammicorona TaxID=994334 RepID=A0A433DIF0_9FUNG|nr:hypothetical protein BC936DRAFT_138310 [Jimgerdemannia flammicorona]